MNKRQRLIFGIALIGMLFSGYLSYSSLLQKTCPLNGECPIFLGFPACVFGFLIYFVIFQLGIAVVYQIKNARKLLAVASITGTIYSAYFVIQDLISPPCKIGECTLLLPSCVYGFVMFTALAYLSWKEKSV